VTSGAELGSATIGVPLAVLPGPVNGHAVVDCPECNGPGAA
jgi:hypothetical protein